MEFLKELFPDGQALTYDQLAQAAKGKGFEVVNAAGGAYVPKSQHDLITSQLNEANTKLKGYDPEWQAKAEAGKQALDKQRLDFAIERGAIAAGARDVVAVTAHIDRSKLKQNEDGSVIGLDQQFEELKKGEKTAFLFEQQPARKTGMSHQNGHEGQDDKKNAANDALRRLFGR